MRTRGSLSVAMLLLAGAGAAEEPASSSRPRSGDIALLCRDQPHTCYEMGIRAEKGVSGVQRDPEAAGRLYQASCAAGDPAGCGRLGKLYYEGLGVPRDYDRALSLLNQACDAKNPYACTVLGAFYWEGKAVPIDEERAVAQYAKACDISVDYCNHIAELQDTGWGGMPRNAKRAAEFYRRGCERGSGESCFRLGDMCIRGDGVSQDMDRGLALWVTACRHHEPAACEALRSLRKQACARGPVACAEAKRMLEKACRDAGPGACPSLQ